MQFAAAMPMVALVVGGSWLAVQNGTMGSRLTMPATRGGARAQTESVGDIARTTVWRLAYPLLASLVFLPNLPRAAGNLQQLTLGTGAQLARQFEPGDDFPRFRGGTAHTCRRGPLFAGEQTTDIGYYYFRVRRQ